MDLHQFIDEPLIKEKYGFEQETFTKHLEKCVKENLLCKDIENPTVEDFDNSLAEYDKLLTDKIKFMHGYSADTISTISGKDGEDVLFIHDELLSKDMPFREAYYETMIFRSIQKYRDGAEEMELSLDFGTDYPTSKALMNKIIEQRQNDFIKSFGLDNHCYAFTIVDFDGVRLPIEGFTDIDELYDRLRMSDYVIDKRIPLCDDDNIGKEIEVECEHYLIGETEIESEDAPDKLIDALYKYPAMIMLKNVDYMDSDTQSCNAGLLELQVLMQHEPICFERVSFESGEVMYFPEKQEHLTTLPEWREIREKNTSPTTGLDEVLKIEREMIRLSSGYDVGSSSSPDARTLKLIEKYYDEPSIQEHMEVTEKDEYFESLYLDPDDLLFYFLEKGRIQHEQRPEWGNSVLQGITPHHQDNYGGLYGGYCNYKNISQVYLNENGWLPLDKAVRIMSDNDMNVYDVPFMNFKCVDENGKYCEKDVDCESAYLIVKNGCDRDREKSETLDLTQSGGRK